MLKARLAWLVIGFVAGVTVTGSGGAFDYSIEIMVKRVLGEMVCHTTGTFGTNGLPDVYDIRMGGKTISETRCTVRRP